MDERLAVVVEKRRSQAAIGSLRAEGVYDDDRSVTEAGDETVAIPVTDPPTETAVREVVRRAGHPRVRDLADHLRERGWTPAEVERAPSSWAVVGSVILVDVGDAPRPGEVGEALLALHGGADTVLARGEVTGPHREPGGRVVAGEGDTETVHREHGTEYALDLAEVMFSPGNKAERARMGEAVGPDERVLDAFAGVGYFTLPMARADARVTAIERNPTAFEYLLENAARNGVTDRVEAYRGDCRAVVPALEGGYDRAVLGYYDATAPVDDEDGTGNRSYRYLPAVIAALAPGARLHAHEATPEPLVPERPTRRVRAAAAEAGCSIDVEAVREVKGYSEGVVHVVVDCTV